MNAQKDAPVWGKAILGKTLSHWPRTSGSSVWATNPQPKSWICTRLQWQTCLTVQVRGLAPFISSDDNLRTRLLQMSCDEGSVCFWCVWHQKLVLERTLQPCSHHGRNKARSGYWNLASCLLWLSQNFFLLVPPMIDQTHSCLFHKLTQKWLPLETRYFEQTKQADQISLTHLRSNFFGGMQDSANFIQEDPHQ